MDPNANLEEQKQFAADILTEADKDKPNKDIIAGYAVCLAERQQALDEWIRKGGFLPKDWEGDADAAIRRTMARPDVCICNDYPHKKGMGCS